MSKQQPEFALQKQVTQYLCRQYPSVLFLSDARAFLKLTIPQAVRSKSVQKPDFACPDLIIFRSKLSYQGMNDDYHGMFLELKAESPFKADGSLKKSPHLSAQQASIELLQDSGYHAAFYWEFDEIKRAIDWYMDQNY